MRDGPSPMERYEREIFDMCEAVAYIGGKKGVAGDEKKSGRKLEKWIVCGALTTTVCQKSCRQTVINGTDFGTADEKKFGSLCTGFLGHSSAW